MHDHATRPSHPAIGTLLLFLGVGLLVLCGIEAMSDTGLRGMPRSWHTNQVLWWTLAVVAVGAGCRLLWPQSPESTSWKPTRPGIRFRQIQLYTRHGCHLCDDAFQLLEQHRRWLPRIVTIDIDTDARLRSLYGECVPVVVCDGRVRFKGRVEPALLRRLIEGTLPLGAEPHA